MKKIIIICLLPFLFCTGCSWFGNHDMEKSAQELISDGMEEFNSGNYKQAITNFEKLRDWYPFSKYAILAEYKIADAYYLREDYMEAMLAYEEFENLHPRNEVIPYVIYQMGMCWFNQIDTVDRGQTATAKALEVFDLLIQQFPNNKYTVKAKKKIIMCLKSLAGHDIYVGRFYYNTGHYKSARARFQSVITGYPELPKMQKEAMEYIALCDEALKGVEVELPEGIDFTNKKWYEIWN